MKPRPIRRDFDRAFFERYYHSPTTAVLTGDDVLRRARFVLAYLGYLQIGVHKVLDMGCGTGLWKRALRRLDRTIEYTGVDPSEYLCRKHGWIQSSVADFTSRRLFDLIVCQDVMQYLSNEEAERGIAVMAKVCRGALYFDVPTRDDLDTGKYDLGKTDRRIHVRSAAWYRRRLGEHFISAGGGVFLSPRARAILLALERGR